jgi:hypothetical protein
MYYLLDIIKNEKKQEVGSSLVPISQQCRNAELCRGILQWDGRRHGNKAAISPLAYQVSV